MVQALVQMQMQMQMLMLMPCVASATRGERLARYSTPASAPAASASSTKRALCSGWHIKGEEQRREGQQQREGQREGECCL